MDIIPLLRNSFTRCCYIGPHKCDFCHSEFMCDGADGCSGDNVNYKGMHTACLNCWGYISRPTGCLKCFKKFISRNELFRHLYDNPEHILDIPEKCPKCNKSLRGNIDEHISTCFYEIQTPPESDLANCIWVTPGTPY